MDYVDIYYPKIQYIEAGRNNIVGITDYYWIISDIEKMERWKGRNRKKIIKLIIYEEKEEMDEIGTFTKKPGERRKII